MFHFSTAIFFCQGQFPADLAEYCYDVVLQIAYKLCAYEEIYCVKHLIFEKKCAIMISMFLKPPLFLRRIEHEETYSCRSDRKCSCSSLRRTDPIHFICLCRRHIDQTVQRLVLGGRREKGDQPVYLRRKRIRQLRQPEKRQDKRRPPGRKPLYRIQLGNQLLQRR